MSDANNECCSGKNKCPWKCIYAILHLLMLTCIATALWQIKNAIIATGG